MKINLAELKKRNQATRFIRQWFDDQDVMEVETPLMNPCATVEAHLDSLVVQPSGIKKSVESSEKNNKPHYLITSPEYNLKKILALCRHNIFQIAHSFRDGDIGAWHRPEFLMLEWYLLGTDLHDLMDFCEKFLKELGKQSFCEQELPPITRIAIDDLFLKHAGVKPSYSNLTRLALDNELIQPDQSKWMFDDLFFLVFLNLIEPQIRKGIFFLYNYPASLAALSKIKGEHCLRFEIYWNGIELANGYQELLTRTEYESAFKRELAHRQQIAKPILDIDIEFLGILEKTGGLPECSGIALGLDRLYALLFGEKNIHDHSSMSILNE